MWWWAIGWEPSLAVRLGLASAAEDGGLAGGGPAEAALAVGEAEAGGAGPEAATVVAIQTALVSLGLHTFR